MLFNASESARRPCHAGKCVIRVVATGHTSNYVSLVGSQFPVFCRLLAHPANLAKRVEQRVEVPRFYALAKRFVSAKLESCLQCCLAENFAKPRQTGDMPKLISLASSITPCAPKLKPESTQIKGKNDLRLSLKVAVTVLSMGSPTSRNEVYDFHYRAAGLCTSAVPTTSLKNE